MKKILAFASCSSALIFYGCFSDYFGDAGDAGGALDGRDGAVGADADVSEDATVPFHDIRGIVRTYEKYVFFYFYESQPCGCEARPVELGQCVSGGDSCAACPNCLESATITDEYGQSVEINNDWHTDLNGTISRSTGYSPGDIVSIEVRGCETSRSFSIVVPDRIASSSNSPVLSGTAVHYSWEPQSLDAVEIMASDGMATRYCWTLDDGDYELTWLGPYLYYASIDHLKFIEQIDVDGWPIEIYADSGTFYHYI